MINLSVGILQELSDDIIRKYVGKITSIFEYNFYDSYEDVPLMPFKDSILLATLVLVMKDQHLNEDDAERYIALEVNEPQIQADYKRLRRYYSQLFRYLHLSPEEELLAYVMFADPIIQSTSEYNVGLSINRLLVELLNDEPAVFDWGFAQGAFLVQALLRGRKQQVAGIEISHSNYIVTRIRMRLMRVYAELTCKNLFFTNHANPEKYAAVICPPVNNTLKEIERTDYLMHGPFFELHRINPNKALYKGEWPYILKALESLDEGGRLFALTSSRAFSNELSAGIRDYLIEEGWVECIIQLSKNLLPANGRPTTLWVFSRKNNRRVRMIDATKIRSKVGRFTGLSEEDIRQIADLFRFGEQSKYNISKTGGTRIVNPVVEDLDANELLKSERWFKNKFRVQYIKF